MYKITHSYNTRYSKKFNTQDVLNIPDKPGCYHIYHSTQKIERKTFLDVFPKKHIDIIKYYIKNNPSELADLIAFTVLSKKEEN